MPTNEDEAQLKLSVGPSSPRRLFGPHGSQGPSRKYIWHTKTPSAGRLITSSVMIPLACTEKCAIQAGHAPGRVGLASMAQSNAKA